MLLPYEGEGRDGYRDQIVTCDCGCFSEFQDTSTVHEVQQWHKHTVFCISLSELVSCAFSTIPICPFLIQRIFHSLVYIGANVTGHARIIYIITNHSACAYPCMMR